MRTSLVIATLAVVGAGAIGAGATFATQAYQGSDTLYDLTNGALPAAAIGSTTVIGSGLGNSGDYAGGGSGAGESAMTAASPTQWTAPMSKMLTATTCSVPGTNGPTHASGVVIGLDAVDVYSSTFSGETAGCSNESTAGTNGLGLAYGTTISYSDAQGNPHTLTFNNWTDVLALLYGGLDKSQNAGSGATATGYTDCNSPQRKALVSNWANLFEANGSVGSSGGTCTKNPSSTCTTANYKAGGGVLPANSPFGSSTVSGDVTIGGALWHAFRRDDASGTSDAFASLIGLGSEYQMTLNPADPTGTLGGTAGTILTNNADAAISYSVSEQKNNGFGVTPYCNALNWDTTAANEPVGKHCQLGAYHQFVGPGGVPDQNAGVCSVGGATCSPVGSACGTSGTCVWDGTHRRPPRNTWGDASSEPVASNIGADVVPTSFQDNDPIRRPCIGLANMIGAGKPAEEVCNIDNPAGAGNGPPGQLGLVLPMAEVDWLGNLGPTACNGSTCAAFTSSLGACGAFNSGAEMTVAHCATSGTKNNVCPDGAPINGGCQLPVNAAGTSDQCENNPSKWPTGTDTTQNDGRIFNLVAYDGTTGGGPQPFPIPGTATLVPFTGAFARLHQTYPIWDTTVTAAPPQLPVQPPGSTVTPQNQGPCTLTDMTDQIACLTQADPCSVGYAGDGGKGWNTHEGLALAVAGTDAMEVSQVYPTTAGVQNGSYYLWRKLYFNSSVGFDAINGTATLTDTKGVADNGLSELGLGQFESNPTNINALLSTYEFFSLSLSPNATAGGGANAPFCEDFNENLLCSATTYPNNLNACNFNKNAVQPGANSALSGLTANFSPIPSDPSSNPVDATTSTVCGNGIVERFEDCDYALTPATCSKTCRLVFK